MFIHPTTRFLCDHKGASGRYAWRSVVLDVEAMEGARTRGAQAPRVRVTS
jgi:hypothetical protein